ncbi:MAG TPA: FkbM family methyltransferase [Rickettsia endosymbiont of Pyrocoelia pectoralis]|nr:FkbM family methyltransferase [Rickettsia endosymbiont of Pyrocoelia pectoralis]
MLKNSISKNIIIILCTFSITLLVVATYKYRKRSNYYKGLVTKLESTCMAASPTSCPVVPCNTDLFNLNSNFKGILVTDKNNLNILLKTKDYLSNYFADKLEWEPHLQNVLRQILKPTDNVLILGGHIGTHAVLISTLANKGQISIFEANPYILKFLKTNLFLNDITNAKLYPKAVFSKNTTVSFLAKNDGNTGISHIERLDTDKKDELITVEAVNIDSIKEIQPIDILQMDIEGAEEDAVYGAQKLIDRSPNLIVFQEWSPFWMKNMDAYLKFWRSRNYKIVQITLNGGLKELTDDELKNSGQIDIIMTKDLEKLINNFKPLQQ